MTRKEKHDAMLAALMSSNCGVGDRKPAFHNINFNVLFDDILAALDKAAPADQVAAFLAHIRPLCYVEDYGQGEYVIDGVINVGEALAAAGVVTTTVPAPDNHEPVRQIVPTERLERLIGTPEAYQNEIHDMAVEIVNWRRAALAKEWQP